MNTFQPIAPIASKSFIPPHRLEIRDKGIDLAPWSVFDTAQTEQQGKDKITRHRIRADCETRIVANTPIEAPASVRVEDTPETKRYLENIGIENLSLRRQVHDLEMKIEELQKAANPPPPPPVDAITGAAPLPFSVGALLRDIHTGVAVRVTEINPLGMDGNPRPGFAWESTITQPGDKDHTGFCPINSAGCYEVVDAAAKSGAADKKSKGSAVPAPELGASETKPPAEKAKPAATKHAHDHPKHSPAAVKHPPAAAKAKPSSRSAKRRL